MKPHIRWMIRRDLIEVVEIESQSFEHPRSGGEMLSRLRKLNVIGVIAEHSNHVLGFMFFELQPGAMELTTIAVHDEHRRKGIGSALLDHLARKLNPYCRKRIRCEIRETNVAGQVFFRANRFQATDVLHGLYYESDEAAYAMERKYTHKYAVTNRITRYMGAK